jgi:hypothetical protein
MAMSNKLVNYVIIELSMAIMLLIKQRTKQNEKNKRNKKDE